MSLCINLVFIETEKSPSERRVFTEALAKMGECRQLFEYSWILLSSSSDQEIMKNLKECFGKFDNAIIISDFKQIECFGCDKVCQEIIQEFIHKRNRLNESL